MTRPLSSHLRESEEPEAHTDVLRATTYKRVTVLYTRLRSGNRSIALRRVGDTPIEFSVIWLNEHGAFCDQQTHDNRETLRLVTRIRESESYVAGERGPAENLWPGAPYYKHPSWRSTRAGGER